METAVRPHRGGIVLALGLLGLLSAVVAVPLGIVAWILGARDLKAMNAGRVDPAGRTATQIGLIFGIAGTVMWIVSTAWLVLMLTATVRRSMSTSSDREGFRTTTDYYAGHMAYGAMRRDYQYDEAQQPNGRWVKEGPGFHWSEDGKELEAGTYHDGKRAGRWIFHNADGSIDAKRTGEYENDVKVRD